MNATLGRLRVRSPLQTFRALDRWNLTFCGLVGASQTDRRMLSLALKQMTVWVLDLPHPSSQGLLIQQALAKACERVLMALTDEPSQRACLGLSAMVCELEQGLRQIQVVTSGDSDRIWPWRFDSLGEWLPRQGYREVRVDRLSAAENLSEFDTQDFRHRLLTPEILAHFAATPGSIDLPDRDCDELDPMAQRQRVVEESTASLVRRGIWSASRRPRRIWELQGLTQLLWPLSGRDLLQEMDSRWVADQGFGLSDCRSTWREMGWLIDAGDVLRTGPHPDIQNPVEWLQVSEPLKKKIERWRGGND